MRKVIQQVANVVHSKMETQKTEEGLARLQMAIQLRLQQPDPNILRGKTGYFWSVNPKLSEMLKLRTLITALRKHLKDKAFTIISGARQVGKTS